MTFSPPKNASRQFSAMSPSALCSSGNWTEAEESIETRGDLEVEAFTLVYHGWLNIDRRYAPNVFQWLAKKLLRLNKVNEKVTAHISRTNLKVTERNDHTIITQEHSFESIYRLSRLRHCNLDNYFAFIIHEKPESSACCFHVFQCNTSELKAEFLKSLKTRVLGFQKTPPPCLEQTPYNITPPLPTHKRGSSSGPILINFDANAVFKDSVYYIGKVTISQPQAPPKFIDDVLVQLNKMHSARPKRNSFPNSSVSETNFLQRKIHSFDNGLQADPKLNEESPDNGTTDDNVYVRQRSISMIKHNNPEITINAKDGASDEDVTLNSIQEEVNSRLVTLQVSKMYLMLFSVGSKTMLLEKKINNISFCTKGDVRSDHFGFICREGACHVCYIFQGESEQKVEAIMKAMKQAFDEALDASAHLTLCESCPLQALHKLCTKLESTSTMADKDNVILESSKCLSEYEQLHIMEQVNDESPKNDLERIEINVNVLREAFDGKQASHRHLHRIHQNIIADCGIPRERPRSATIFEKAKKSLTSSFQSFTQKKQVNGVKPLSPRGNAETLLKPRSKSYESSESFPGFQDIGTCQVDGGCTNSKRKRSISTSFDELQKKVPEKVEEKNEDKYDGELKVFSKAGHMMHLKERKGSWRQEIYHSVTQSRKGSSVSSVGYEDGQACEERNIHNPHQRAQIRWKKAINNQILLIRMDRENKKLAASIKGTEERREKMSYRELGSYTAESANAWDDIISHNDNEKLDNHILLDALRGGVPKARRGEIWQVLVKQFTIRLPESSNDQWKNYTLQTLLRQHTNHQHAILIDLGRTFPTHDYFVPRLGSGQLSLFNMLKAYSLLDNEVGYCQGLSFVAGLFLMHMSEEDAFKSFCHVMFDLKIRCQYKPDMNAVQQQLYQLSRLLHDFHPTLYNHLNDNDVTPTLYAAPWFLTLYASQYPIGFVARVMDLLLLQGLEVIFKVALVLVGNHKEEILKCDSFESIVEYMKTVIPEKVVNETDDICTRALDMDIKLQLNLYEVEYQLLHEEMIDIRQSKERMEKQELAHKELENQVADLQDQLTRAHETIAGLEAALAEATGRGNRDFLNRSGGEREQLTLSLNHCNSHGEGKNVLNNDLSKNNEKYYNILSSPDSVSSSNSDMTIGIDPQKYVNDILSPSSESGTCDDEFIKIKKKSSQHEHITIDKEEKEP